MAGASVASKTTPLKPHLSARPRAPAAAPSTFPAWTPPDAAGSPRFYSSWGDDGPPAIDGELQRHFFRRDGVIVRIKLRYNTGRYANSYRVTRPDGALGWQMQRPQGFVDVPYVGGVDPFDRRHANQPIYWPEDEKDCDALGRLRLGAFCFGGIGDGLPDGCERHVASRDVVILASQASHAQDHAQVKAALADRVARSVKVIVLTGGSPDCDVSDWLAFGGVAALKARIEDVPEWEAPVSQPSWEADARGAREAPSRAYVVSAPDLGGKTLAPIKMVVPNLIAEGVTLLLSSPKQGKSWMALDICLAAAADRSALGAIKPLHGDVLYLALEDSHRRLQRRIEKMLDAEPGACWPQRFKLAAHWRRLDDGGLDDLAAWCRSVPHPVLICIDTLAKIRPRRKRGKTAVQVTDDEVIAELQTFANAQRIAIVLVHHDRRSGDAVGLAAAADGILRIRRAAAGTTLHARGRDIAEADFAMRFDSATCRWTLLGAAAEVQRSNERARIVEVLRSSATPLSTKDIMVRAQRRNRGGTDVLLWRMVEAGEIVRVGRGEYRLPEMQ
jgi:lambda repressor-like predicted transcriptional regulator